MTCGRSIVEGDVAEIGLRVDFMTCSFAIFEEGDD